MIFNLECLGPRNTAISCTFESELKYKDPYIGKCASQLLGLMLLGSFRSLITSFP